MVQHPVRIDLAPFCEMGYVNDERYLPVDEVPDGEKLRKKRKHSVEPYQTEISSSATSFTSHKLRAAIAAQNLNYDEELFVDYAYSYECD